MELPGTRPPCCTTPGQMNIHFGPMVFNYSVVRFRCNDYVSSKRIATPMRPSLLVMNNFFLSFQEAQCLASQMEMYYFKPSPGNLTPITQNLNRSWWPSGLSRHFLNAIFKIQVETDA